MDFDVALDACMASGISAADRDYVRFHTERFRAVLAAVAKRSRAGSAVANVGLSCFDLIAVDVLSDRRYVSLVPSEAFVAQFPEKLYSKVPKTVYDVVRADEAPKQKYDVVIMADVLEHLFCEDEPVIENVIRILAPDGAGVFSFPNAMRHVNRLRAVTGGNVFPAKKDILHGVFGGYGHIREYTMTEIRDLLAPRFEDLEVSGLNVYGSRRQRSAMALLPHSMRSTILAVASKPKGIFPR
jgi:SAM-dependent methyltransferase